MTTLRRHRLIVAQTAWMLAVVIALSVLEALRLDVFFVTALVGFLVVVDFYAPVNVEPDWRRRLRWFVLLGLAAFALLVARRLLRALPGGTF